MDLFSPAWNLQNHGLDQKEDYGFHYEVSDASAPFQGIGTRFPRAALATTPTPPLELGSWDEEPLNLRSHRSVWSSDSGYGSNPAHGSSPAGLFADNKPWYDPNADLRFPDIFRPELQSNGCSDAPSFDLGLAIQALPDTLNMWLPRPAGESLAPFRR